MIHSKKKVHNEREKMQSVEKKRYEKFIKEDSVLSIRSIIYYLPVSKTSQTCCCHIHALNKRMFMRDFLGELFIRREKEKIWKDTE